MVQSIEAGNCLVIGTSGVLVRGRSGAGKTTLSNMLIELAKAKGNLGSLVSDDYTTLINQGDRLVGRAAPNIIGQIEVRGFGVVETPYMGPTCIDLVVDLVEDDAIDRLPEKPLGKVDISGIYIAYLKCPENKPDLSVRLIRYALRSLFKKDTDYI